MREAICQNDFALVQQNKLVTASGRSWPGCYVVDTKNMWKEGLYITRIFKNNMDINFGLRWSFLLSIQTLQIFKATVFFNLLCVTLKAYQIEGESVCFTAVQK